MCRRTVCGRSEKPTFTGCARHVEQALGDVPEAQRCRCRETPCLVRPRACPSRTTFQARKRVTQNLRAVRRGPRQARLLVAASDRGSGLAIAVAGCQS